MRLWIKDNGICVSPEHQERIFRLFEHLHGIETYSGIGVGLAIIHRGIMQMGGNSVLNQHQVKEAPSI